MGRRYSESEPKTSAWKPVAYAFILLAVMLASNARAETIEDTQFGFTLVVPHGYIHLPANGDNVHIFSTSNPADGWPDALVSLQRMHGQIDRGHVPLLLPLSLPDQHEVLSSMRQRGWPCTTPASAVSGLAGRGRRRAWSS